jgi:hypothetical protein
MDQAEKFCINPDRMTHLFRKPAFFATLGALAHIIFWAHTVNAHGDADPWSCGELSCWILIYGDFPVSLLYAAGSARSVALFSLSVGTFWWAGVIWLLGYGVRGVVRRFHS